MQGQGYMWRALLLCITANFVKLFACPVCTPTPFARGHAHRGTGAYLSVYALTCEVGWILHRLISE